MASPNSSNVGNDGTEHSSVSQESVNPVQSLKGMSLSGLNGDTRHSSNTEDSQTQLLPPDEVTEEQPKTRLSWGQVTEIPTGGTSSETNSCKYERSGLPLGGASSSGNPWQVRSTQNPSKPFVRRPTPMVLRVPKSVIGNDLSKMCSFEENEEEDDENNGDNYQPISSMDFKDSDTMIVEDIEEEGRLQGSSLPVPQDLPVKPGVDEHVIASQRDLNADSPTVFIQTEFGKQMSLDEVENDEGEDVDDQEDEEDECQEENQFLSPSNSMSFGKVDPPKTNTHVQTVPHQPRRLVRRDTPQTLDIPETVRRLAATSVAEEILEEEEEEEEEEEKEDDTNTAHHTSECGQKTTTTQDQTSVQKSEIQKSSELSDSDGSHGSYSSNTDNSSTGEKDSNKNSVLPTCTHDDNVVKCENNNPEAPSIDLTNGARTTTESKDSLVSKSDYQSQFREREKKQSRFKKSMSGEKKEGSSSPSSVRRKVSPHHTKILTRQPTPVHIDVPKHLLSESFKSSAPPAFLEEEEGEEN
ncbi:uncharacterized protein [Diadema antillarum]|uniref:uncharacterized protein n=1 Tax=Diadema antillarum TaxID=105358 RepID=UPI003A869DF1